MCLCVCFFWRNKKTPSPLKSTEMQKLKLYYLFFFSGQRLDYLHWLSMCVPSYAMAEAALFNRYLRKTWDNVCWPFHVVPVSYCPVNKVLIWQIFGFWKSYAFYYYIYSTAYMLCYGLGFFLSYKDLFWNALTEAVRNFLSTSLRF